MMMTMTTTMVVMMTMTVSGERALQYVMSLGSFSIEGDDSAQNPAIWISPTYYNPPQPPTITSPPHPWLHPTQLCYLLHVNTYTYTYKNIQYICTICIESLSHGTPRWFIGEQRYFLSGFPATVIVKDCYPWELVIHGHWWWPWWWWWQSEWQLSWKITLLLA